MAYKSVRQMCYEKTMADLAADFDREDFSKKANVKSYMYAKRESPVIPHLSCYLCGTHEGITEIKYGDNLSGIQNVIMVCDSCCKWLGEFLLSDEDSKVKEI